MPRGARNGWTRDNLSMRINLASGTSAEELLTDLPSGFERVLEKAYFVASGDGAGASASRTLRVIKGASTVAASVALALADNQTKGAVKELTLATSVEDRTFRDADTITVDVASGGTEFTTCTGNVILRFRQRAQLES